MIRTQISFDEDLYREAQAEAKRLGISLAELCRRAVGSAIQRSSGPKLERPWMRFSGVIRASAPDASHPDRIDEIVYGSSADR